MKIDFDQIPASSVNAAPQSTAATIGNAVMRGELTIEDGSAHMALHVAESLTDHPVRPYFVANVDHQDYVNSRLSEAISRDQHFAQRNGRWIHAIVQIRMLNYSDIDMLSWAIGLCEKHGAVEKARKIRTHLAKHLENEYPKELFNKSIKVQEMDSEDKRFNRSEYAERKKFLPGSEGRK